ncbi:MAG: type II toxin-antitoxin system HipA family toxin [Proteobacteria bacterium]|nr:type II toxin-antitoxin system HipA family toxin [Pseudomonadota bacterium]MBU1696976.1 type II toxin-antitoxin system HipA family toxin [Pseudomonadota bacterium]
MKNKLNVFVNQFKVGELWLDDQGRFCFQYCEPWLNNPNNQRLSISLPLRGEPFLKDSSYAYFTNLLPEGKILSVLSRNLGISDNDYFGLLKAIGGDCAGAVSLHLAGVMPSEKRTYSYEALTEDLLLQKLKGLRDNPFLSVEERRMSLAGAQEKLPVYLKGNQILLPVDGAPSTHIVKTPIQDLQGTVINETYCMMLAKRMGLEVPEVKIRKIGDLSVYMIRRYDRIIAGEKVVRVVQEDFCQALKVNSQQKYDPTLQDYFGLIKKECTDPIVDSRKLFNLIIFNGLIGNADGHAKNISLIHDQKGTRLAPFYDLLSTHIYRDFTKKMPGKIAGKKRNFFHLKQKHFRALGHEIGIKPNIVIKTAIDMSEKILEALRETTAEFKSLYNTISIVDQINRIIKNHADTMIQELSPKKNIII